jgi:hypothetical protein
MYAKLLRNAMVDTCGLSIGPTSSDSIPQESPTDLPAFGI